MLKTGIIIVPNFWDYERMRQDNPCTVLSRVPGAEWTLKKC